MVIPLAADDQVIASASVDGQATAGARGVDHVVAVVGEADRVTRHQAEAGLRVVTLAVLRCVAVDNQGGGRTAPSGDGEGVTTHDATAKETVTAAMQDCDHIKTDTRSASAGSGHSHRVVALAQHHLGDLDVIEGDTSGNRDQARAIA